MKVKKMCIYVNQNSRYKGAVNTVLWKGHGGLLNMKQSDFDHTNRKYVVFNFTVSKKNARCRSGN